MIIPSALEPVTINIYNGTPFTNSYKHHYYRPQYTKNNVNVTRVSYLQVLNQLFTTSSTKHTMTGTYNFNYNNGLVTSVILEVPYNFDGANYMVVSTTSKDLYYFITNVIILNHTGTAGVITCKYELELDVIATFEVEFSTGIKSQPIQIERKHCQRFGIGTNYATPYCSDIILNEPELPNVNPNVIAKIIKPTLNVEGITDTITENSESELSNTLWYYILGDSKHPYIRGNDVNYVVNKHISVPLFVGVLPATSDQLWIHFGEDLVMIGAGTEMNRFFDSPNVYNIKISPLPPFTSLTNCTIINVGNIIELSITAFTKTTIDSNNYYVFKIGDTQFELVEKASGEKTLQIKYQDETEYSYTYARIFERMTRPSQRVNPTRDNELEVKAQFSPYKKYLLKTQYSQGEELHPEIIYSTNEPTWTGIKDNNSASQITGTTLKLKAISTAYVPDLVMSYFVSYATAGTNNSAYFKSINNGFINSPNYVMPSGTDALKAFEQTQGNSFNTQKLSQIVGGALSIAGGIVGVATGHAGIGGVAIASGVSSIGFGIGGAVAKYSDLANTPDTVSALGSTPVHDYAVGNTLHPYICVYELTPSEKEIVYDYFYEYGYNVQRCCYFNLELYPSNYQNIGWVDDRVFTRDMFNYVKTAEDITEKIISYQIPFIVKKKLSDIFKNGITLWSFISSSTASQIATLMTTRLYTKTYENGEVY